MLYWPLSIASWGRGRWSLASAPRMIHQQRHWPGGFCLATGERRRFATDTGCREGGAGSWGGEGVATDNPTHTAVSAQYPYCVHTQQDLSPRDRGERSAWFLCRFVR